MAITWIDGDETASKTTGTTLAAPALPGVALGDLLVVAFASDAAAGAYSCGDDGGNTYTERVLASNAANVLTRLFTAPVTAVATIVTVTHPSLAARAMCVGQFRGASTTSGGSTTNTGTGTTPSSGAITPSSDGCLVVGAVGFEGNTNGPQDPAFSNMGDIASISTTGGGAASNIGIVSGLVIQTTAASANYQPTIGSFDWAGAILALQPSVTATPRPGPPVLQAINRASRF